MLSAGGLNFLVAVDGSPAAHLGFQVVIENLLRHTDRITVAHIFNRAKTYLPYDQQPENLHKIYETQTITLGSRGLLVWQEIDERKTTKEQVIDIAVEN